MSHTKRKYELLKNADVCKHNSAKYGIFRSEWVNLPYPDAFKETHGSMWKTVAHRMRTWYAAKFKQANRDGDARSAYRYMDLHNHMLHMIQDDSRYAH